MYVKQQSLNPLEPSNLTRVQRDNTSNSDATWPLEPSGFTRVQKYYLCMEYQLPLFRIFQFNKGANEVWVLWAGIKTTKIPIARM